jgi:hypothetical protein
MKQPLSADLEEIISIIKVTHSVTPPEIIAAKALLANGYTEYDVQKVRAVDYGQSRLDEVWILRTCNAMRDIERNINHSKK